MVVKVLDDINRCTHWLKSSLYVQDDAGLKSSYCSLAYGLGYFGLTRSEAVYG